MLPSSSNSRSLFAERANRESLLSSEELFDYFARVQLLVNECLSVITTNSPSIAMTVLEVGSEVVAKLHRNKSLYKRRVEYVTINGDEVLKDAAAKSADEQNAGFICDCFDLGRDLVNGKSVASRVEDTKLSRMFAERFVRAWLLQLDDYEKHTWDAAQTYDPSSFSSSHAVASGALFKSYQQTSLDHDVGYGVVRYVRERVAAIDKIYDRITTAYMRVILKIAKANALPNNDDHFLELYQFGYFGIARANTVYDYVLQAKYVAVAKWWVRQSIMYHMKASSGIIKISPSIWQQRAKMDQIRGRVIARQGYCTDADIAAEMGCTERVVANVYESIRISQVAFVEPGTPELEVEVEDTYSLFSDTVEAISTLPVKEQVYLSLLYDLGHVKQPEITADEIEWQRLRQRAASVLIVEA